MASVYNDQENQIGNLNKAKATNMANQVQKRSVLGTINSNRTKVATRVFNKALQKNSICVQSKTVACTFSVHEDKTENLEKKVQKPEQKQKKTISDLDAILDHPIIHKEQERKPLKEVEQEKAAEEKEPELSTRRASPSSVKIAYRPKLEVTIKKTGLSEVFDLTLYKKEILIYLKEIEQLNRPKPNYMRRQPDVTYSMRTILVDWLVEVAEEYKLQTQTLFLAVSFIDRFLSTMSVVRAKLQLLGTAAMFVAAKCEEIYPPEVAEFVYITDDTYTTKQVLKMEYLLLKVLAFEVSVPTTITFVMHFSVMCDLPEKVMYLAMYLCELALLEGDPYLQYLESIIASSAIAVARHCLGCGDVWPASYTENIGYALSALASCIQHLNTTHANAKSLQQEAVNTKYGTHRYLNVREVEPMEFNVGEYILQMKELNSVALDDDEA